MSIEGTLAIAVPWSPLLAQVLVFWYLTNVGKKNFWTHAAAADGGAMGFMRRTMLLHPVAAGIAWGAAYPWMPAVDAASTRGEAIMWGMVGGVCSTVAHKLLRWQAEQRGWTGVLNVLSSVGKPSTVPPEAP